MAVKKNISYQQTSKSPERHQLDIYFDEGQVNYPVIVFMHGGSWSQGSKDLYEDLGNNLLKLKICTVIINYRLAPTVTIKEIAEDCANAVKWTKANINEFGGNNQKIVLMGHSAGGHLAALVALNPQYSLITAIKGLILIDSFGLNMSYFLSNHQSPYNNLIQMVFGSSKQQWDHFSPSTYKANLKIPVLLYVGSLTYPFIKEDNELFSEQFRNDEKFQFKSIKGADHFKIMWQLKNSNNTIYKDITSFLDSLLL